MFADVYRGRRVLVTGNTGFKGSWLQYWLESMGAEVVGYALPAPTDPNHQELLTLAGPTVIADVRDAEAVAQAVREAQPEIVFHLAAQPLVRASYGDPLATFEVNVMGTANVLNACRQIESVRAVINVTSDKCYENREWVWGYRENDPMGGYDPYSASKGCSELVTAAFRNSYFSLADYGKHHHVLVASCRAGNVIGGGDWAEDRLVPDVVRGAAAGKVVEIRNPGATRPWQHVLEPLSGYLLVGQRLLEGDLRAAEGWNFGPGGDDATATVQQIVDLTKRTWPEIEFACGQPKRAPHEAGLLQLDSSKARTALSWRPVWGVAASVENTIAWYRDYYRDATVNTAHDLARYVADAQQLNLEWTK